MPPTDKRNGITVVEKQRKTHAHTLTRVRNNQRRHRERRREYTLFLEQKLKETEDLLAQAQADIAQLNGELEIWKSTNNTVEGDSGVWDDSTWMLGHDDRSTSLHQLVVQRQETGVE